MSKSAAPLMFVVTACSLIAACGAGYDPATALPPDASISAITDSTDGLVSPDQSPAIAAGLPDTDSDSTDIEQQTGSSAVTENSNGDSVEVGSGASTDTDMKSGTDSDKTADTSSSSEAFSTSRITAFNVKLVSVDVRRIHDGKRIDVDVAQVDSGSLHVAFSDKP